MTTTTVAPTRTSTGRRRPLPALTGARFVAALGVVAFHADFRFGAQGGVTAADRLLPGPLASVADTLAGMGSLGVNFFFLLSGFVLAYNYLEPGRGLVTTRRAFYRARFARIYPVYLLALLVALAHRVLVASPCTDSVCAAGDRPHVAVASLLLVQAWLPTVGDAFNGPAWTLSVETFFYACFPFVVAGLSRVRSRRTLGLLVLGALAATQVAPVLAAVVTRHHGSLPLGPALLLQFSPVVRLPEFVAGVATWCWVARGGYPRVLRGWRADVVLLGALPALAAAGKAYPHLGWTPLPVDDGLFDAGFLVVILALAQGTGLVARALGTPAATTLGESSYALYILHWPCWTWWTAVVPQAHRTGAVSLTAYVVTTVLLSVLVWRLVERPARRALLRPRRSEPITAPVTA